MSGKLCLTFDDGIYTQWIPVLPLLAQHRAHATFFFSGTVDDAMLDAMKTIQSAGHSIGLHTVSHADAIPFIPERGIEAYLAEQILPQLEPCRAAGIRIGSFAYPNNRHSEETDLLLTPYFRRFRAGISPCPAKGYWIADQDQAYLDTENLPISLGGNGIGEYYATTVENLDAALERAAAENKLIVFFSHGISENAQHVHMKTAWLERMLKKANDLGMEIIGFDEL